MRREMIRDASSRDWERHDLAFWGQTANSALPPLTTRPQPETHLFQHGRRCDATGHAVAVPLPAPIKRARGNVPLLRLRSLVIVRRHRARLHLPRGHHGSDRRRSGDAATRRVLRKGNIDDLLEPRKACMDVLVRLSRRVSLAEFRNFAGNALLKVSVMMAHIDITECTNVRAGHLAIALRNALSNQAVFYKAR